jgi:hypothetical protein
MAKVKNPGPEGRDDFFDRLARPIGSRTHFKKQVILKE